MEQLALLTQEVSQEKSPEVSQPFSKEMRPESIQIKDPVYEIRPSNRAKYAQIKVTPAGKVLVVVPRRFNVKHVPAFVAEHQQWIDKQLLQLKPQNPVYDSDAPQRIVLRAVDEIWQVNYSKPQIHNIPNTMPEALTTPPKALRINSLRPVQPQLLRWLNERARAALGEQVELLGQETGLKPASLTIRGQKTRWGSCSARKTLSLNRSLLFLPPAMVRYLVIHELCHLVHLNHSQRFWRLVQRFEPNYEELDRGLASASRYIPHWALPE